MNVYHWKHCYCFKWETLVGENKIGNLAWASVAKFKFRVNTQPT